MLAPDLLRRLESPRLLVAPVGSDGRWSVARATSFVLGTIADEDRLSIPLDLAELLQAAIDALPSEGERALAFRTRFASLVASSHDPTSVRARGATVLRATASIALRGFDGAIARATELVLATVELEDDRTLDLVVRRLKLDADSPGAMAGAAPWRLRDALLCVARAAEAVRARNPRDAVTALAESCSNPAAAIAEVGSSECAARSVAEILLFVLDGVVCFESAVGGAERF